MSTSFARRIDRSCDADLLARRAVLAAITAALWPLMYVLACHRILAAHNTRTPQRPPGEPLAGRGVPGAVGGILDSSLAMSETTGIGRCLRCAHLASAHAMGMGSCHLCDCPTFEGRTTADDASPAMLSPPSVEIACEPIREATKNAPAEDVAPGATPQEWTAYEPPPTVEEGFVVTPGALIGYAHRAADNAGDVWVVEHANDERCSMCRLNNPNGCDPRCPCYCHKPVEGPPPWLDDASLGTPTAQPLAEAARLTLARRLPPKPAARLVVMPGADQVRAKECEHCKGTTGAHMDYLAPAPRHANEPETLYVKDGKRYRPALPTDAGPRYRRTANRRYVEVKG